MNFQYIFNNDNFYFMKNLHFKFFLQKYLFKMHYKEKKNLIKLKIKIKKNKVNAYGVINYFNRMMIRTKR